MTALPESSFLIRSRAQADAFAIRGEIGKRKAELTNHMGAMGARM